NACGDVQLQWMGKCPSCGAWDALEKYVEPKAPPGAAPGATDDLVEVLTTAASPAVATPLPEIDSDRVERYPTGIGEFDRVLGGGFVPGSVVLVGGDPGIGKSTLLLQAAGSMARAGRTVLYVTSEESAWQTRIRAERLFGESVEGREEWTSRLHVLPETDLGRILEQAGAVRPDVLVLDSIQLVYRSDVDAAAGSVTQLRRCCTDVVALAKRTGMAVATIGHVTKDGQIAGPRLLEHLVDAVLSFEGDQHHAHRVVRGLKNRYGTTLEVGLFEMTGRGLREVDDAPGHLDPSMAPRPGSVPAAVMQGTRAMLLEVQALTATGVLGSAKRRTAGLDPSRLAMLIAVLEQHAELRLADQDVFTSLVGGLRVVEPAADLALALAVAGAHMRRPMAAGVAAVGEVGLGGEVRAVPRLEARLREAVRHGFRRIIGPPMDVGAFPEGEVEILPARTVVEAMEHLGAAG
ncbi:MAG: DNA repair protein RadA, partial [Planctomycetota bacterium]